MEKGKGRRKRKNRDRRRNKKSRRGRMRIQRTEDDEKDYEMNLMFGSGTGKTDDQARALPSMQPISPSLALYRSLSLSPPSLSLSLAVSER